MDRIKASFKTALLFGLYQLALIWLFDIFSFFKNDLSSIIAYVISFITIVLFHLISDFILSKLFKSDQMEGAVKSISFISSSFLASLSCFWILKGDTTVLLIIISAFVIPALLPSITFFLLHIFKENESIEVQPQIIYVGQAKEEVKEEQIIRFILENESGKKLLDVAINRIICFEANDNYVVTYYLDKEDKIKKSMERISLKKIEEMLNGLGVTSFSRVHKSYLVHQLFISEIKGKAQAQKIKLHHLEILVPVSRTFNLSTLDINF